MGRKILVIEDDADTRAFIAKGLNEHGHVVDQSADGRDGLFMASDGSYDLVILDRMLPALDGLGVLKALRAAGVATPVLILSALASLDDRIAGLENGSDDYLVKPFAFSELLARVNALLRRAESGGKGSVETQLSVGDLDIDLLARVVRRGTPGAGLGLSLVEAVAHLHDGALDLADNTPGLRAALTIPR